MRADPVGKRHKAVCTAQVTDENRRDQGFVGLVARIIDDPKGDQHPVGSGSTHPPTDTHESLRGVTRTNTSEPAIWRT